MKSRERQPVNPVDTENYAGARKIVTALENLVHVSATGQDEYIHERAFISVVARRLASPKMTPREIARETSLPVRTVLQYLQRGRERFQKAADLLWED